jgi:hypothetical protein
MGLVSARSFRLPPGTEAALFSAMLTFQSEDPQPSTATGAVTMSFLNSGGAITHTLVSGFTLTRFVNLWPGVVGDVQVGDVAVQMAVQFDQSPYYQPGVDPAYFVVRDLFSAFGTAEEFAGLAPSENCMPSDPTCNGAAYAPPASLAPPGSVCGPLSGECAGKPFLALPTIATCTVPSNALDVVGWLANIWCELTTVPARIGYFIIGAVNAIIDLIFPGADWFARVYAMRVGLEDNAPFVWIGELGTSLASGLAAPAAGDSLPTTVGMYGQSIAVGGAIDSVTSMFIPYRDWLVVLVRLAYAWWLFNEVLAFVGRRSQPRQLDFGL